MRQEWFGSVPEQMVRDAPSAGALHLGFVCCAKTGEPGNTVVSRRTVLQLRLSLI